MHQTLLLLPGDGIGPEVTAEARRVAEVVAPDLKMEEGLVGGASIDAHGDPLTEETLERARQANAVLLGAVGGPKWVGSARDKRPEAGLLALRKGLDVFANLRPAFCFPALVEASSLKHDVVAGLDLMIVRELTGGVYFGQPRGIDETSGIRRGYDTSVYTHPEIERVAHVAFEIARGRQGRVCSVEKSNVMESGLFWRQEVTLAHAEMGAGVDLSHMYADACAMELVRAPKQFDVILAGNLFGDILSDEAAMLTGSIGMLPSASLGAPGTPGLYEPVHGSAPDIAGQGIANPCAAILSLEMALRWSLGREKAADMLFAAVGKALDQGARTKDLGGSLSTSEMADAIIAAL
ncbi:MULTISPECIES: 3-isopropylmalate dehydrogenase [Hyphomonas]|uniref:3-isopropylmalate dehydrogenase n=1 Tax=Hyphomonas adhaerens TaxID=81029 RepID=A0A3B9H1B9_9PROT|nr:MULTISPECIES: 3-isopropylmalate dehydrogenase [Hyphomonas]MBB39258.1 3-isopropylmalate dehydrogenase [Hyphomonas sp.]HAE28054.1 3-isopropylmalate dehydrogenase [Hyphomonas adhaerens]